MAPRAVRGFVNRRSLTELTKPRADSDADVPKLAKLTKLTPVLFGAPRMRTRVRVRMRRSPEVKMRRSPEPQMRNEAHMKAQF